MKDKEIYSYILTLGVAGKGEWYEAAMKSELLFTEAQIADFMEEVKPILKEMGFMKDE